MKKLNLRDKYFTAEEVKNFKNIFRDAILAIKKTDGEITEEGQELIIKYVLDIIKHHSEKGDVKLTDTEFKEVKNELLLMLMECM